MKKQHRIEEKALFALAIPVMGLLLGAVYSWPAMSITREREPWLTLLLSCGLAITVFGLGFAMQSPLEPLAWVFAVSLILLLLARRAYGSLGPNMERFGMVHFATLVLLLGVICFQQFCTKAQDKQRTQQATRI